jgi:hypothetical protein
MTTDTAVEELNIPQDMTFKAYEQSVTVMPVGLSLSFSSEVPSTSALVPQATFSKTENPTEALSSVYYDESLNNRPTFDWTPILLMPTNTEPSAFRKPGLAQDSSSTRPGRESVGEATGQMEWSRWMRGPSGVGTFDSNVRRPGPSQDGLNEWARKHIPGIAIDSLLSTPLLRAETAHFGPSNELASISKRPGISTASETQTPSSNQSAMGLENVSATIGGWVRRLTIKGPGTPKGDGRIEAPDSIELLDEVGQSDIDREVETPLPPQLASNADENEDTGTDCHQREFQNSPKVTMTNKMINDMTGSMDGEESTTESYSGESETGSNNSAYLDLCKTAERDGGSLPEIIEPVLDPMRQALVDRIMEEFWDLFDQEWDTGFVKEAAGISPPSGSGPTSGSITSENSIALPPIQRQRQREEEDPPEDRNGRNPRQPRSSVGPIAGCDDSTRFACPFRKHDSRKYSVYSHRVCALSHWETIARVKYAYSDSGTLGPY